MKKFLCLLLITVLALTSVVAAACVPQKDPDPDDTPDTPKLTALGVPFVTVNEDGMAGWNAVPNAVKYTYKINNGEEKTTYARAVQLNDGDSLVVKAVGDGETYGESAYCSPVTYTADQGGTNPDLKPLATPFVTVDNEGLASWSAVANAVKYTYKINGGEEQSTALTQVQLTDGDSIAVKAVGDGETYGQSAYCSAVKYAVQKAADGWYVLTEKIVDGIDSTSRYVVNTLKLAGSEVNWYEVDISGSHKTDGIFTYSGETVSMRFGSKQMDFKLDYATGKLSFSGTVNRQQLSYKFQKDDDYKESADKGQVAFTEELFGDDITKNYYNYCPTIMMEGRTMHIWYCSNKDDAIITDYVAYRKGELHDDGKWTFSEKQLVLEATAGQWDYRHVCDPSVVKGNFVYKGGNYNYMMAYLGCMTSNNTKNEVGVAFATVPEGPWVKAEELNPIADYYEDFSLDRSDPANTGANKDIPAAKLWGYGQPSLVSVDKAGKVILFYTKGSPKGTYTTAELWDMSNVDEAKMLKSVDLTNSGITNASGASDVIHNSDFAYDPVTKRLYCIKEDFPYPTDSGINWISGSNTLFYAQLDANETQICDTIFDVDNRIQWTKVGAITQSATGFVRNHNCGIVTDPYGWLQNAFQVPVVYTMSLPYTDFPDWTIPYDWGVGQWPALHTYRLHGYVFDIT